MPIKFDQIELNLLNFNKDDVLSSIAMTEE